MMKRCACVIAALAVLSLHGARGQALPGESLQGNETDGASQPVVAQLPAAASNLRAPPPGGNPLWGVPLSSLSATRERPLFTASRHPPEAPPPPMPVAEAPPPPPPQPEHPPFTLVGTAIGQPQNVALLLDQTTKSLVRLHVGEAASGWYLRSVELRTMTIEKNNQVVTLSLPAPGSVSAIPPGLALASGVSREF